MAEHEDGADTDGAELISRVRIIEGQPLPERAAAYAALHDVLVHELDTGVPGGGPGAHAAPTP